MEDFLNRYLYDPTISRLIFATVGVLVVIVVVRLLQRMLSKYVQESSTRYRARKAAAFFGYILAFVVVATIYSDRLGGFTVNKNDRV